MICHNVIEQQTNTSFNSFTVSGIIVCLEINHYMDDVYEYETNHVCPYYDGVRI